MQQELTSSFGKVRADAIYTDAMSRLYGLVALGIVTTGAAIWIGDRIGVGQVIVGFGWIGYLAAFGIMIGTLIAASKVVAGGNTGLGTVLYLAFTGFEGFFLSPILMAFTGEMIGLAFVLTAGLFVAMSAVGMTTKRDLSKLGPMLFIGLIGMINHQLHQPSADPVRRPVHPDKPAAIAPVPGSDGLGDEAGQGAGPGGRDGRRRAGRESGGRAGQHRSVP